MTPALSSASPVAAGSAQSRQIVVFSIGGRAFGVDVGCVREIRGWQQTTELPNSPAHMLGVINLRGAIVPVFDLQARLGFGRDQSTAASVVIVVEIGDAFVGFVSDGVSDIVDVLPGELRDAPEHTDGAQALLKGLAIKGADIIGLLDLEAAIGARPSLDLVAN